MSSEYWNSLTDEESNVLIIGIDFGTTYSGVAWATPLDLVQDQINLIHTWPDIGLEKGKAPTQLYYEDDQVYWGYGIPQEADPVQWFKLLLLRDEDLGRDLRNVEYVQHCRRSMRLMGKSATDLVADYLQLLWEHVLDTICRDRGASAVEGMRFHVVLTVPAIWPSYARQSMGDAAVQAGLQAPRAAGMTKLSFVTEPEAAALATLHGSPKTCRPGDVITICDAGGGTVDLISYNVTQSSPLVIEEAVEGMGGLYGGIFIDEAFEEMAQRRLGRRWKNLSSVGIKELVQNEWQQAIKPQYRHMAESRRQYTVGIPAEAFRPPKTEMTDLSKEPYIKMGRFFLRGEHIEKMFAWSIKGIDMLIDQQIRGVRSKKGLAVTDIILVGGLGASPYLYQHLRERHGSAINILQSTGTKPWTAICRGAVYKGFYEVLCGEYGKATPMGMPVEIASTVARHSVGICFSQPFDKKIHKKEDRYCDNKEEALFARNQMEWYLRKGSSVRTLQPVRHEFYLLVDRSTTKWTRELYTCTDTEVPTRKERNVRKLCDITCHFESIVDRLPDYVSPSGKRFKKFEYEIVMIPSGAAVEFEVLYQGMRLAGQVVNVCFQ